MPLGFYSIIRTSPRAVEAYHGRLQVQSTLGKGSTFSLILPILALDP